MAMTLAEQEGGDGRRRKRKRADSRRKLVAGDKVEVRSEEDGLLGSWHSATVTRCDDQIREVQYNRILNDDGSGELTEVLHVSPLLDGRYPGDVDQKSCRGYIRPSPPVVVFGPWDLPYGWCVDVYHENAWWEGVVFDNKDGSEKRNVFFPDLGDEQFTAIGDIRITQDWDESTCHWRSRGFWSFLQMTKALEEEWPLPVSVKQIWYDLREKWGLDRTIDWTSRDESLWKKLVLEVINENLEIVLRDVLPLLDSASDLIEEDCPVFELPALAVNVEMLPKGDTDDPRSILPVDEPSVVERADQDTNLTDMVNRVVDDVDETAARFHSSGFSVKPGQEVRDPDIMDSFMVHGVPIMNPYDEQELSWDSKGPSMLPEALPLAPFNPERNSCNISRITAKASSTMNSNQNSDTTSDSTGRNSGNWLPLGPDLLPGAQFCPDAVVNYVKVGGRHATDSLVMNVRKHLSSLGWEMQCTRRGGPLRVRYMSPHGKCYYSLLRVCQDVMEKNGEFLSLTSEDADKSVVSSPIDLAMSLPSQDHSSCGPNSAIPFDVQPIYCPQAVVDYYMLQLQKGGPSYRSNAACELRVKVKMHLLAVGWTFCQVYKGGRFHKQYVSPSGSPYFSLRIACKRCMNDNVLKTAKTSNQMDCESSSNKLPSLVGNLDIQKTSVPSDKNTGRSELGEVPNLSFVNSKGRKTFRSKKNLVMHCKSQTSSSPGQVSTNAMREGLTRCSGSLSKSGDDLETSQPSPTLVSRKRVRHMAPRLSQHHPKTILSWLMDNNVVLPRDKVFYRRRRHSRNLANGRLRRDGINCSCCGNVFTLNGFVNHAGGANITDMKPVATIFLGDGRSLLDCQLQAFRGKGMSRIMRQARSARTSSLHDIQNDYICSVCHYGGELILCDGCPSSFHKSCLGLKDVPDGNWFCPSCCCAICNRCKSREDAGCSADDHVLRCNQCERKYHIGCLRRTRGVTNLERDHKMNWFCSKMCKKVSVGLSELLEKPRRLGPDNLTWTLLKCVKPDYNGVNFLDDEAAAENYVRLNLALDVMHECFEPVKEPYTSSDLIEDLIFNRRSELNRVNFQGFYTVLLEKDDELITVATVRIYGGKVAEVPLVGTRFHYRRLGMCRILMDELEKRLKELGVETLVLPAVSSVLNTWTTSFGFKKMTDSERSQFLGYTFLDFQGTVMCQKRLVDITSADSNLPGGSWHNFEDDANHQLDEVDLVGSSAVFDILREDTTEGSETVAEGQSSSAVGSVVDHAKSSSWENFLLSEIMDDRQCGVEASSKLSNENALEVQSGEYSDGRLKCYQRRRKL